MFFLPLKALRDICFNSFLRIDEVSVSLQNFEKIRKVVFAYVGKMPLVYRIVTEGHTISSPFFAGLVSRRY